MPGPNDFLKIEDIPEDQIIFYDIETDSQYAPYANIRMVGAQIGINGSPFLVESYQERRIFREMLASPNVLKVNFNGTNYDNMVLWRHGFPVNEHNHHDCFLMAKTCAPALPAYSLKFINFYYFGDFHRPEKELDMWAKRAGKDKWDAPKSVLGPYCLYDVSPQTVNTFLLFWEVVQRELHWRAYSETEAPMFAPLEEICLRGGEYLDRTRIKTEIENLTIEKIEWEDQAWRVTNGKVKNPNSVKQVGTYLQSEDQMEVEITDAGNFSIKKADLLEFLDLDEPDNDENELLRCTYEVRRINNSLNYLRHYSEALEHSPEHSRRGWIPKEFATSRARTRRILSSSRYKINFQNPNDYAKSVHVVPAGWLGWWVDATQIENVVHIYETQDHARRESYEADPNWNEYVWLANRALGSNLSKKELDDKSKYRSPINAAWSVYKQYKTTKLGVNFGMGVDLFCKTTKLSRQAAALAYRDLHEVCPAIRNLQQRVSSDIRTRGYVQDALGHIYSGTSDEAYKIVAYLIQGCGTGSLPKRQIRLNYDTVHQYDEPVATLQSYPGACLVDEPRQRRSYGHMCGTCHDENSGRISLALGTDRIVAMLQQLNYNMTEALSPLFDNIPLRSKLYLSKTTEAERQEFDINDTDKIIDFINA